MKVYDIVILGGNIAAMSAGIYSGMANIKTLQILYPEENIDASDVNKYLGYKKGTYEEFHANTLKQMNKFSIEKINQSIEKIVVEKEIVEIIGEEKIGARAVIISTEEMMEKIEGNGKESKIVFTCGQAFNNSTKMISLAGTGCMAAMDARIFLSK